MTFTGFTWSSADKIQFYPWVSTTTDGYQVGEGYWYNAYGPLFTTIADVNPAANRFGTDLYAWATTASIPSYFWEDGFTGSQVYLKARSEDHAYSLTTFDEQTDWSACLNQSTGWIDYVGRCGSRESPGIRIETNNFISWADRAMTNCHYNGEGCTTCVNNVRSEFNELVRGQQVEQLVRYNLAASPPSSSSSNATNHFQGIARLSNINDGSGSVPNGAVQPLLGRVVLARDRPPELFVVEEEVYVQGDLPDYSASTGSIARPRIAIDTALDHPGGLWAAGDIVAVPVECADCTTSYNEVIFYQADGFELSEINRLVMNGSQGEPFQTVKNFAAAVTFIRLRGGQYLLVVGGQSNGTKVVYFYVSDSTRLAQNTSWTYIDSWVPPCSDQSGSSFPLSSGCYGGSSGLSIFAQCDGRIFVAATNGVSEDWTSVFPPYESHILSWATLMEVEQSHVTGDITLVQREQNYLWGTDTPGGGGYNMRYGATIQVGQLGTLVGTVTQRDADMNNLAVRRFERCADDSTCL